MNKNLHTIASIPEGDTPKESFAPVCAGLDSAGRPTTDAVSAQKSKEPLLAAVGATVEAFSFEDDTPMIDAIEYRERLMFAVDKLKVSLDLVNDWIRQRGSQTVGDYQISVAVIERKSCSLTVVGKYAPDLYKELDARGLVTKSESERLSIRLRPKLSR